MQCASLHESLCSDFGGFGTTTCLWADYTMIQHYALKHRHAILILLKCISIIPATSQARSIERTGEDKRGLNMNHIRDMLSVTEETPFKSTKPKCLSCFSCCLEQMWLIWLSERVQLKRIRIQCWSEPQKSDKAFPPNLHVTWHATCYMTCTECTANHKSLWSTKYVKKLNLLATLPLRLTF